ncbi:MAG: hypothetical protein WCJ59_01085 [bacterium]
MSAEARELVRLTTNESGGLDQELDFGQLIVAHPELAVGMKEYLKWRDGYNKAVAKTVQPNKVGHEVGKLLAKLAKNSKKKKEK